LSEIRILVVEDERTFAGAVKEVLTFLGYAVTGIASTAAQARESVARQRPDLVLMDIRLNGEPDGIQLAAELRRRFGMPVVYLTAHADASVRRRAMAIGPCGYVVKPFSLRDLKDAIEAALEPRTRYLVDAHPVGQP
jgi:DNA-binding response OmpR family regulator